MTAYRQDLHDLIEPAVNAVGYECWGCEYLPQGKHSLLRVYIDHPEGISLDDCEAASRQISAILDVEDPINGHYDLEVSSPGIDRPLFRLAHYERYRNALVKIKLQTPVEARRQLTGIIKNVIEDKIQIEMPEGKIMEVLLANISKASLVA